MPEESQPQYPGNWPALIYSSVSWFGATRRRAILGIVTLVLLLLLALPIGLAFLYVRLSGKHISFDFSSPHARPLTVAASIMKPPIEKPDGPLKVAVFFPDPAENGSAAKDGGIQARGFRQAIMEYRNDHPDSQPPLEDHFKVPLTPESDLFPRIQGAYAKGYRVFVVTMSSAMAHLHEKFSKWHIQLKNEGKPLPVLIGTVASAPKLADSAGGMYRLYIRSEEEAEELARYARWQSNVDIVGVFLITRDANLRTDKYGEGGFITFDHEFGHLGGHTLEYKVLAENDPRLDEKARAFVAATRGKRAGAFIVGYGSMLSDTIQALARQHFGGPIFCASTLTEPTWQPPATALDASIVTIEPHRDTRIGPDDDEYGVVFFFTKYTLARVLAFAAEAKDSRDFQTRWQIDEDKTIGIQHLADGDAIVPVAVTRNWRADKGN